jgi:hypothetical protein
MCIEASWRAFHEEDRALKDSCISLGSSIKIASRRGVTRRLDQIYQRALNAPSKLGLINYNHQSRIAPLTSSIYIAVVKLLASGYWIGLVFSCAVSVSHAVALAIQSDRNVVGLILVYYIRSFCEKWWAFL